MSILFLKVDADNLASSLCCVQELSPWRFLSEGVRVTFLQCVLWKSVEMQAQGFFGRRVVDWA